ncbi:hypothetical protein AB3N59_10210 [Leptospira sp. WS92.C1]
MRKGLSKQTVFPKTESVLFSENSKSLSYVDVIKAVRLADLPEKKFLKQILFASVIGALKGFQERDLKPFHTNHKSIFSKMNAEILQNLKLPPSPETISREEQIQILKQAFDFGVKKVYHLEWKIYTSRELY